MSIVTTTILTDLETGVTTRTTITAPTGVELSALHKAHAEIERLNEVVRKLRAAASKPTEPAGVNSIADYMMLDRSARMIQRLFRGHRDMREQYLGFTLRKQGSGDNAASHAITLWTTEGERSCKTMSVTQKHDMLVGARGRHDVLSLGGSFGHSVVSRVANLGKGAVDCENPMMLAQHQWLEATDQRHRYGAYLFNYYELWAAADTKDSFFYWLDFADGKDVSHETVPRTQLEGAEVTYCAATERKQYVVVVRDGKMYWLNQDNKPCHPQAKAKVKDGVQQPVMMIYVMAPDKTLYIGDKKREKFHHSSFLSGSATIAAGSVLVDNGLLKEITPHSGHYRPSAEDFQRCLKTLEAKGVDMTHVATAKMKARKEKNLDSVLQAGSRARAQSVVPEPQTT